MTKIFSLDQELVKSLVESKYIDTDSYNAASTVVLHIGNEFIVIKDNLNVWTSEDALNMLSNIIEVPALRRHARHIDSNNVQYKFSVCEMMPQEFQHNSISTADNTCVIHVLRCDYGYIKLNITMSAAMRLGIDPDSDIYHGMYICPIIG